MPGYNSLKGRVTGQLIQATIGLSQALGDRAVVGTKSIPAFADIPFSIGDLAGQVDTVVLLDGTLNNTVPGTSNLKTIDLTAVVDIEGETVNCTEVCFLLVYNRATTASFVLKQDGTVTNAFKSNLDGIATGKLSILPGWTSGGKSYPGCYAQGGFNQPAWTVSGTNKVFQLDSITNVIPYAGLILARR